MSRREFIAAGAAAGLVLVTVGSCTSRAVSSAGPPLFVSRELPGLWSAATLEVSADARKAYLGRWYSEIHNRQNLLVLSLDRSGRITGGPDVYPDSARPLPVGGRSTVVFARVHPRGRKLYLSTKVDYPGLTSAPKPDPKVLSVLDLDATGLPTGPPRSYDAGFTSGSLEGLALHPNLDLLYLVGFGAPQVVVYRVDKNGEPQGIVAKIPVGGSGKYEVAVGAGGDRLYLGSYPNVLQIVTLDPSTGFPPAGSQQAVDSFDAGPPPGSQAKAYYQFLYTPQALYRRFQASEAPGPDQAVQVWQLDPRTGKPSSSRPTQVAALTGRALAVDTDRQTLWLGADDTFKDLVTGGQRRDGTVILRVPLDEHGLPAADARPSARSYFEEPISLAVAAKGGEPVVLTADATLPESGDQVRGWHLRVTLVNARPAPTSPLTLWLSGGSSGPRNADHPVGIGESAIFSLDENLTQKQGQVPLSIGVGPYGAKPTLQDLTLQFDVFDGSPTSGTRRLTTLTETVAGNFAVLLVPGYGFIEPGERTAQIELLSDHAKRYLDAARRVGLKPTERPQQFIVSCSHLLGYQAHNGQLATTAEALGLLGFNTVNAYDWGGLSPDTVNQTLSRYGLERRAMAVYSPMSGFHSPATPNLVYEPPLDYFDFYLGRYPGNLNVWAEGQRAEVATQNGAVPAQVVDFKLSDEPGWYYPNVIDGAVHGIVHTPAYLEAFRSYLRDQRLTPEFFGERSWSDVQPNSGAVNAPLATRRSYYWTARFFAVSASRGHKLATEALERAFGHQLSVDVNWNNSLSEWCVNGTTGNQPNPGSPQAATGSFDWFESGRLSAHTPWSEDWFPDPRAQLWSTRADVLRSVSMLGTRNFGAYVVGATLGQYLPGASYKILSLVGHGAKTLDVYAFGPRFFKPDAWSERLDIYPSIADALRLLGRAEHLLYPGRPRRGKVAIHLPSTSALYDESPLDLKLYALESTSLHYALIHAGYTVDFIDDTDLVADVLMARGYTTLYLTGPNVPQSAFPGIASWVRSGHVLAVTPGAAVADEYNTPSAALDDVLGLAPRSPVRSGQNEARHYVESVTPTDGRFGTATVPIIEPAGALATRDAPIAATFKNGGAAITRRPYGNGTAIAYGFFPGFQYFASPDDPPNTPVPLDPSRLPGPWGVPQRLLVIGPAVVGQTPKPVSLDHDVVEACRLDAPHGVAVVLLNWSGRPIESLTVTISDAGGYRRTSTARRVKVNTSIRGTDLAVKMPLADVDILMLER